MIDRVRILDQMGSLDTQRRQHEDSLRSIDGAMQLCRFWLGEIDRLEAEAKAKESGVAETNGDALPAAALTN